MVDRKRCRAHARLLTRLSRCPRTQVITTSHYCELDAFATGLGITSWTWAGGDVFDLGSYTSIAGPLPSAPANLVPEPGSLAALSAGLLSLTGLRMRKLERQRS